MENSHILGIDIGTSNIKVLVGSRQSDGSVAILGSGAIPTEGFTKGNVNNIEALTMSIKQAVECAAMATDIKVEGVYLGIGGMGLASFDSRGSIVPTCPENITYEDIDRVYRAAVLAGVPDDYEVLHVLPRKFLLDKETSIDIPLQKKCLQLEVECHIVTVPKEQVRILIECLKSMGINVLGIVSNAVVIAQALNDNKHNTCLYIDIGAGTTELILYNQGKLWWSVSLPIGSDYITNDIMQGLGATKKHAEEIKRYYVKLDKKLYGNNVILDCSGFAVNNEQVPYDFLSDIVESRLDEIIALVHDYVSPVLTKFNNIDRIFLTGGCMMLSDIDTKIAEKFQIPAEIIMPPNLPREYASQSNVAAYGILKHVINNLPIHHEEVNCGNTGQGILTKLKKIFRFA